MISCLEERTAGDPDEEDIVFTDLSPRSLAERLDAMGTPVGRDAITTWLDNAGIRLRQIRKDIPGGEHPDRNAQFERIAKLIEQFVGGGYWLVQFLGVVGRFREGLIATFYADVVASR